MENMDNNKVKIEEAEGNSKTEETKAKNEPTKQSPSQKAKDPLYKKWWFWVIIGVLVIAIAAGSSGSDSSTDDQSDGSALGTSSNSSQKPCNHSYMFEKTEATCTSGGYDIYKCKLCSNTKKEYKSALGHTTNEGTCSRCGESFGIWEAAFYVDEFNTPTSNAYIRNSDIFYGTFSNSATTNSTLYVRILIDEEDIAIKLWEYGSQEVNAYTTTDYKITILDDSGTKHYTTGTMYKNGDRIYVNDWSIVNLLQSNSQIKIYIQENSKYGVNSTYLFTVKKGNFNSVYSDYYYKYMK